jgi:hypothetical protein
MCSRQHAPRNTAAHTARQCAPLQRPLVRAPKQRVVPPLQRRTLDEKDERTLLRQQNAFVLMIAHHVCTACLVSATATRPHAP